MFKRIVLFVLTNIFILVTISIVVNLLGIGHYITASGIDYGALLSLCLVWGMVGSFISLALSRVMAKMLMRVEVVDPTRPGQYQWFLNMVHDLAKRASLPKMPEVGVYKNADPNAFATGPTKSRALVAASTGLLDQMSREEIEGVVAHEITHIKNGDMVTMTLIQGVINAFVMFFARIVAYAISQNVKDSIRPIVNILSIIVLQILFGMLGMVLVCWFSRKREFRADSGSASLAGREKMIAALEALQGLKGRVRIPKEQHSSIAAFQISDNSTRSNFALLFATHPPLEERIEALRNYS